MKFVFDTEEVTYREPVAAIIKGTRGGHILLLRRGDYAMKIWDDASGSTDYDWAEEISENTVLKLYYPGDKIEIEV